MCILLLVFGFFVKVNPFFVVGFFGEIFGLGSLLGCCLLGFGFFDVFGFLWFCISAWIGCIWFWLLWFLWFGISYVVCYFVFVSCVLFFVVVSLVRILSWF